MSDPIRLLEVQPADARVVVVLVTSQLYHESVLALANVVSFVLVVRPDQRKVADPVVVIVEDRQWFACWTGVSGVCINRAGVYGGRCLSMPSPGS